MDYGLLRLLHIACAALSVSLFLCRGMLQWRGIDWRGRWPWLKVLPHINDTLLLSAAVALAWLSGQTPWAQPWLGTKVLALLFYIVSGRQALRGAPGSVSQLRWFALALASVGYILFAAHWRQVFHPFF